MRCFHTLPPAGGQDCDAEAAGRRRCPPRGQVQTREHQARMSSPLRPLQRRCRECLCRRCRKRPQRLPRAHCHGRRGPRHWGSAAFPSKITFAQRGRTHQGGPTARRSHHWVRRSVRQWPPHLHRRRPGERRDRTCPCPGDAAAVPNPITSSQAGRTHRAGSSARRPQGWGCC